MNRSLLNTEWYGNVLLKQGLPRFFSPGEHEALQKALKGPVSDTLIVSLIDAATEAGRPVYFASTLSPSPTIDHYRSSGRLLGLVSLVTPPPEAFGLELQRTLETWLRDFRTAGLDGWRLPHSPAADAG